jgi:hypothetical protein
MTVTLSLFAGAGAQFLDNSGNVLTGGLIYTYTAGTTTPLATYTSNLGTSAHPNPIVLDASGRVPGGEIWLNYGYGYKFVLKDANNVLIGTYDNIPSAALPPIFNDASSISYEQGYSVTAGAFVVGSTYLITSIGTTNFQTIGATSNTVGLLFTATGAGTGTGTAQLSRTVQSKLQETVSVKDFGATGDGTTDDTAAINAAIIGAQGKTLYIPAGQYKLTSTINFGKTTSILGEGAQASVFVLTHSGVGIQINNPLPAVGDTYNQTFEKFGITANASTTNAFFMMRCVYCNFKDIQVLGAPTLGASFVGFRVSGAMYLNTYENCIFDTTNGSTAAVVGKGWYIGNGQNDVNQIYAATNVNTFITCRAVRIGTGMDIENASGCIFINPNCETAAVAAINVRGNYNQFTGVWIEAGELAFNQYTPANGSGGFGAAVTPFNNTVSIAFPCNVSLNYANRASFYNSRMGNVLISANSYNTTMNACDIGGTLTNNGSDCNLQYIASGNQYETLQFGTSTYYSKIISSASTKIEMNASQYIQSQKFGTFKFSTLDNNQPFEFANAQLQLDKITAPASAPANSGYLFVQDNGAGKMQLAAKFPSGAIQVIATEP